ncbi:MAG TPA: redoxin family protein [Longimicrobium sp.]|nr:redoxin family protein [Longimicrobium sp.]
MRRRSRWIIASLVAVLASSGWKAARASVTIARAPRAGEQAGLATVRGAPVRAEAEGPLAKITRAERAVVFIYAPDCSVCHANMANWIDLVGTLRGGATALYAVSPTDTPAARAYWGALERHVRVVIAAPAQVHRAFGVQATPATLLVQDGTVRGEIIGSLTAAGRAQVRRFAAEGRL